MKYTAKDKRINDQFYGYFLRHNQDDGWGDTDKYGNFHLLSMITDYTKKPFSASSVLDVGSGTGDFAPFLKDLGCSDFLGIDLYQMSVEYAQMKYPEYPFVIGDFLSYSFGRTFDYVFFSGTLAAVLATDNYDMLRAFIKKMWSLATMGIAFNFITREPDQEKDEELFLYDLEEVLRICHEEAPDAQLEYRQNHAGEQEEYLQTHVYLLRRD